MRLTPAPDRIINDRWFDDPDWASLPGHVVDALNGFILHMEDRSYSPHSTSNYFIRVRAALAIGEDPMAYITATPDASEARMRAQALQVWAQYIGGQPGEDLADRIRAWRESRGRRDGPKGGRVPKDVKTGLPDPVFTAIRKQALADPDVRGVVVAIMCVTPLRVGDVLRITRRQAQEGRRTGRMRLRLKGGKIVDYPARTIDTQLRQLLDLPGWQRVQDLLGGTYSAASKRVARRLKRYGRKAGHAGDLHLHLLRHTVLTRIADRDGTRVASGLAGHSSETTTIRYVKRPPPLEQMEEALARGMVDGA